MAFEGIVNRLSMRVEDLSKACSDLLKAFERPSQGLKAFQRLVARPFEGLVKAFNSLTRPCKGL